MMKLFILKLKPVVFLRIKGVICWHGQVHRAEAYWYISVKISCSKTRQIIHTLFIFLISHKDLKNFFFPYRLLQCLCISGTWRCAVWACGRSAFGSYPHGSQRPAVCAPSPHHRDRGSYSQWTRQTSASPRNVTRRAGRALAGRTGRRPANTFTI